MRHEARLRRLEQRQENQDAPWGVVVGLTEAEVEAKLARMAPLQRSRQTIIVGVDEAAVLGLTPVETTRGST